MFWKEICIICGVYEHHQTEIKAYEVNLPCYRDVFFFNFKRVTTSYVNKSHKYMISFICDEEKYTVRNRTWHHFVAFKGTSDSDSLK